MSLFAQRKIVEIRMANAAPGEQGADAIVELAGQPSPDTLVLIITAKLDGRTQSSRWVSAVEKSGVLVQVWPIDLPRLPAWIRERLGRHKLQADPAAAALLAERVEGNLLAAHQEIEKLALLLPPGPISAETVLLHRDGTPLRQHYGRGRVELQRRAGRLLPERPRDHRRWPPVRRRHPHVRSEGDGPPGHDCRRGPGCAQIW